MRNECGNCAGLGLIDRPEDSFRSLREQTVCLAGIARQTPPRRRIWAKNKGLRRLGRTSGRRAGKFVKIRLVPDEAVDVMSRSFRETYRRKNH